MLFSVVVSVSNLADSIFPDILCLTLIFSIRYSKDVVILERFFSCGVVLIVRDWVDEFS